MVRSWQISGGSTYVRALRSQGESVPQFTGDDGISDGYPRLMEEALRAALDVLLPELQRTAGLRPLIEERGDWVMLLNQEGHGQGVQLRGDGEPDELAQLA